MLQSTASAIPSSQQIPLHDVGLSLTALDAQAYFGIENVTQARASLSDLTALTPFQTEAWLRQAYQHLAPSKGHQPCLVVLRSRQTGMAVFALPLVIATVRGLKVAGFPDYGIADYGAPILAANVNWSLTKARCRELWTTVRSALGDVDYVSLTNMPRECAGLENPFAQLPQAYPSAHQRFVVTLDQDVETFLASRGKKYRKEAERCYRLLDAAGPWSFERAQSHDDVDAAFAALQRLQAQRWHNHAGDYHLEDKAISDAYRANLHRDAGGEAQIFQLMSGRAPIAALYGVAHGGVFTLLRIASAHGKWRRLSPGRLIVLEAMRHFHRLGVVEFDLGIGGYAFKRGLGARTEPLVDVEYACSLRARPRAMLMQAKGWIRGHPRLLTGAKTVRDKFR